MKQFFIKLGDHPIYKKLLKEPLTYVAGAVLLAVFQIAHFAALGSGWGVTSAFANWGTWIYKALGGDASGWVYYASEKMQKELNTSFLADGGTYAILALYWDPFPQRYLHHSLRSRRSSLCGRSLRLFLAAC